MNAIVCIEILIKIFITEYQQLRNLEIYLF